MIGGNSLSIGAPESVSTTLFLIETTHAPNECMIQQTRVACTNKKIQQAKEIEPATPDSASCTVRGVDRTIADVKSVLQ